MSTKIIRKLLYIIIILVFIILTVLILQTKEERIYNEVNAYVIRLEAHLGEGYFNKRYKDYKGSLVDYNIQLREYIEDQTINHFGEKKYSIYKKIKSRNQ